MQSVHNKLLALKSEKLSDYIVHHLDTSLYLSDKDAIDICLHTLITILTRNSVNNVPNSDAAIVKLGVLSNFPKDTFGAFISARSFRPDFYKIINTETSKTKQELLNCYNPLDLLNMHGVNNEHEFWDAFAIEDFISQLPRLIDFTLSRLDDINMNGWSSVDIYIRKTCLSIIKDCFEHVDTLEKAISLSYVLRLDVADILVLPGNECDIKEDIINALKPYLDTDTLLKKVNALRILGLNNINLWNMDYLAIDAGIKHVPDGIEF